MYIEVMHVYSICLKVLYLSLAQLMQQGFDHAQGFVIQSTTSPDFINAKTNEKVVDAQHQLLQVNVLQLARQQLSTNRPRDTEQTQSYCQHGAMVVSTGFFFSCVMLSLGDM
jgi:hypothetical protein